MITSETVTALNAAQVYIHPALFNPFALQRLERETGRKAVGNRGGVARLVTPAELQALNNREQAPNPAPQASTTYTPDDAA